MTFPKQHRAGLLRFAALIGACWAIACGHAAPASPMTEYMAGIRDATRGLAAESMPTIVLTWGTEESELGQCKRIAGEPVVYLHLGAIVRAAASVPEARALIAEVLEHELGHARLSCSDADHALLPRPAWRAHATVPPAVLRTEDAWHVPRSEAAAR